MACVPGESRLHDSRGGAFGFAVNKGDVELLDALNAALRKLKETGQLRAILDRWGVGHLMAP